MPKALQTKPGSTRAAFQLETWNEEKRTIDICWTAGSAVKRWDWSAGEYFWEKLEVSEDAIRMERLNNGAPLLDSHRSYSISDVIGVVERAWVEGGMGYATVRLTDAEKWRDEVKNIIDGIVRNVSVGYTIYTVEFESRSEGDHPVYKAVDWEPFELSMVPIGADDEAGTRNQEEKLTSCQIRGYDMPEQEKEKETKERAQEAAPASVVDSPPVDVEAERGKAAEGERKRAAGILEVCRKAGVEADFGEEHIAAGTSIDEFRGMVIDKIAEKSKAPAQQSVKVGEDGAQKGIRALEGGLAARALREKAEGNAADFRYHSLVDICREMCEMVGTSTRGMAKGQIVDAALQIRTGYQGAGDLANITSNVANKVMRKAYQNAAQTYVEFCSSTEAPDFKAIHNIQASNFPALREVNEHGEFTRGTITDNDETYMLVTYGRIVALTRQAIINDDLSALTKTQSNAGYAASNQEATTIFALLAANAATSDGDAFFHANHGNLESAAAPSITSLTAGIKLMGNQQDPDGNPLNLVPKYLLCGYNYMTVAEQLLSSEFVANESDKIVTRSMRRIEPLVDARITDNTWYLIADPMQIETVQYAHLEGESGPQMTVREGFDVDGIEFKVRNDFGAGLLDYRGAVKFPNS